LWCEARTELDPGDALLVVKVAAVHQDTLAASQPDLGLGLASLPAQCARGETQKAIK
jgi:hypothetical protein